MHLPYTISRLSDSALVIDFESLISAEINAEVMRVYQLIYLAKPDFVIDIVPAYSSVTVHYDVFKIYNSYSKEKSAFLICENEIIQIINKENSSTTFTSRQINVPVCYDLKYALDIEYISAQKNISIDEIVSLHTSIPYKVYMIGFLPGFPYMAAVDEKISIPRKREPRLNIASGSVGIAGNQTGIYPFDSPGGWQIIGRTPVKVFDKNNYADPVFFKPGDEVTFHSISADEFANY